MIAPELSGGLSGFSLKKVLRSHARLIANLPGAKNSVLIRSAAGVKRSWEKPVEAETLIELPEDTAPTSTRRAASAGAAFNWKLWAGAGVVAVIAAAWLGRRKVSHAS